ncbi:hypothetical protein K4F52_003197 [Lecanicillium sp. MT-2017a]|nr:hypothetical protein K4F52_003197 [Lecanicillium sp. MT-2017a]
MGSIMGPVDTSSSDTSILDATFWTDTVPRLVRENLAVRYANMAVHILILSKQPELMSEGCSDLGPDHYSQALAHYGLALRQMRQSIEAAGGPRAAILCSMFFVIFEAINGDKEAAEAHLFSGQRLLEELHQLVPAVGTGKGPGSLRKELRNLLQYISLQVRIGGVNCWKGEMDAIYGDYLTSYTPFENPAGLDSPGLVGSPDPFLPVMWTDDVMF